MWSPSEDEILIQKVIEFKGKNWKKISAFFNNRSPLSCSFRWKKIKGEKYDDCGFKFTEK